MTSSRAALNSWRARAYSRWSVAGSVLPEPGDLADRQALLEPEPEQLDASAGRRAERVGPLGLPCGRLAHDRPWPRPDRRRARASPPAAGNSSASTGSRASRDRLRARLCSNRRATFRTSPYRNARNPPGRSGRARSSPPPWREAFDEDLLDRVVQHLQERRAFPPGRQVGPDHRHIPTGERLPRRGRSGGGLAEHRPAGGIRGSHGRSIPEEGRTHAGPSVSRSARTLAPFWATSHALASGLDPSRRAVQDLRPGCDPDFAKFPWTPGSDTA